MAGDIARPVQMTNGNRTKITRRYVSRCSTLYDQASSSLAGRKRKCWAITFESALHERSARAGSKFRRKCPVKQSEDDVKQAGQYSNPGGLEMEIAAPAVLVRKHVAVAGGDGGSGGWNRQFE